MIEKTTRQKVISILTIVISTITIIIVLLTIYTSTIKWSKGIDDKIKAVKVIAKNNVKDIENNVKDIKSLQGCERDSAISLTVVEGNVEGLQKSVNKLEYKVDSLD